MKNLVFAGTPEISQTCLQALIDAGYNIQACLTQPDRPKGRGRIPTPPPVKELAEKYYIPVFQPTSLRKSNIPELLKKLSPDLIVVVAYGLIIPKNVLEIPEYGCINVHTSLLPKWRGAAPMQHAILAGDTETGVTIMQMDAGLDTGDILTQYPCQIEKTTSTAELYQKLSIMGAEALTETLDKLWANKITPIKQQDEHSTYAHKINKQDGEISWDKSAQELDQQIRAFNPWPVSFIRLETSQIRIWQASPLPKNEDTKKANIPGTILNANANGIEVATGIGSLLLTEIQLPGKKKMHARDILNANQKLFTPGTKLADKPE